MTNELLFAAFLFGGLSAGVLAARAGPGWVEALIITLTLYLGITEAKIVPVFGLPTTLGTALYGVLFFLTDVLGERWGRAVAFRAVRRAIAAAVVFQILLQATRIAAPIAEAEGIAQAMDAVFGASARIVAASLVVYAASQSLDVWLFHRIRAATAGRHLWLRNTGSTLVSQAVDTWAFTFLAFYGVYDDWATIAAVMYGFKVAIALSDTGFIYLARWAARGPPG